MMDLYARSIEIILANQAPSGAYVASPNFPSYRYCWFRDGAFIAYAMDIAGHADSASRFHAWAASTIHARADVVARAVAAAGQGNPPSAHDILHTRYTLDGRDGRSEEWPNFQLDGFGTWLWSLEEHARLTGNMLPEDWLSAAGLVAEYLASLWHFPCFDCWEEFPDQVHTYTLASIYAGLRAHRSLSGVSHTAVLNEIRQRIDNSAIWDGHFAKALGRADVDASLLSLSTPYRLVAPESPVMLATVAAIERDLRRGGGVHRYPGDTYYGGGEWVLLTAWLGWYYAEAGQREKAAALLDWVEAQADEDGNLPEQTPATLNAPGYYQPWRQRWGEIARPLLWSHAKYLILKTALEAEG
jgi:GH15 family glucan-1,4-alpha-glucosidase